MPRRPPKRWMRRCVAGASKSAADPGAVCGSLWYHKMSAGQKRAALAKEEQRENPVMKNAQLFQALHGHVVGGKMLYHEYPDLLMWAGADKWSVFATPDYDERGAISIEASTEDGDAIGGPKLRYRSPLTPEQYLELVRPYVETDPRQWTRSEISQRDNPAWTKVFG